MAKEGRRGAPEWFEAADSTKHLLLALLPFLSRCLASERFGAAHRVILAQAGLAAYASVLGLFHKAEGSFVFDEDTGQLSDLIITMVGASRRPSGG